MTLRRLNQSQGRFCHQLKEGDGLGRCARGERSSDTIADES